MCGISGVMTSEGPGGLGDAVRAMNATARHRGPDDEGTLELPWIALGHRRLSIIDLSAAGHQPMRDSSGRFAIVFNGEIYNYLELRSELGALGHDFRTATDTEVVLEAYKAWGAEAFQRFNGMWAIALVDTRERSVVLCRDRFGVKPLYYDLRPGRLVFASELKQLLAVRSARPAVNVRVAADFFFWSIQGQGDETFVEGIRALPGGHLAEVSFEDLRSGRLAPRRYWKPAPRPFERASERVASFRSTFEDAVRIRMRSDVPVGVTLSGGLDSSSIASTASALLRSGGSSDRLRAFTAVFEEQGFSEEGFARAVAESAALEHELVRPAPPDLAADWQAFVRCMDEPFASLSFYANWKVYERIRAAGVPVILNGQGGDELLLGYPRYRPALLCFHRRVNGLAALGRELVATGRRGGVSIARLLGMGLYFDWPWIRSRRRLAKLGPFVKPDFLSEGRGRTGTVEAETTPVTLEALVQREFEGHQLQHLLHHEDRVSMHFAVESRNPLLDYRLFEIVQASPPEALVEDGWSKRILREAMEGRIPEVVRRRTDKMGFDTPTGKLLAGGRRSFVELLRRNEGDRLLETRAISAAMESGRIDANVLCSALSYLSWSETIGATG